MAIAQYSIRAPALGTRRLVEYLGNLEPDGGAGMENQRIKHATHIVSVVSPVVGGGLGLIDLLNGDVVLVLAAECGFESRPWHLCP